MTEEPLDAVMFNYTNNSTEEENKQLKELVAQLKNEVDRYKQPALMVCEVHDMIKEHAIIKIPNGNLFFVTVSKEAGKLRAGDQVLVEQKNLTVIKKINSSKQFNVEKFVIIDKPKIKWSEVGGLDEQAMEIKEVIELPLKKPELFKAVGITPPKGILLHGEPGNGKTLLAKAVAASTNSTFIEIVGSELVQKFIGEGAKLVKEVFELAREKAPAIVFIDEIDALAAKRIEIGTSGEREVQRTFMQLLAEIDGFKNLGNVKIVGCTNRIDILDPAITRPGRLDRLIKIGYPNEKGRREIFKIHTSKMPKERFKMDKILKASKDFSGAEIKAAATEAGYFAIRENRSKVTEKDFLDAIKKVKRTDKENPEFLHMFG